MKGKENGIFFEFQNLWLRYLFTTVLTL